MKLKLRKNQPSAKVVHKAVKLIEEDEGPVIDTDQAPEKQERYSATNLINASKVKQEALLYSKNNRNAYFSRVSKQFLIRINSRLRNLIHEEVQRHPSRGKTIQ